MVVKGEVLCVKSAPSDVTNWGSGLGQLIIQPPSPWDTNGAYIILYHRLVMDRANNVHLSSCFLEFTHYEKGLYPRIGAIKSGKKGKLGNG